MGKILERDKLKNRDETGNAQFSRALGVNFPNLSLNGQKIEIEIEIEINIYFSRNRARDLKNKS